MHGIVEWKGEFAVKSIVVFWTGLFLVLSHFGCSAAADEVLFDPDDFDSMGQIGIICYATGIDDLSDLESACEHIVMGIVRDDSETVLQYHTKRDIPLVVGGHTVRSVEITQVYQGDLRTGDVIKLAEPYYIVEDEGSKSFRYTEKYYPSTSGKEYLFFLSRQTKSDPLMDTFSPTHNEIGRYPNANAMEAKRVEEYTNHELNLGGHDSAKYREIYSEVIAKYMQ